MYKSRYGAARRYAQLLAAELGCEAQAVDAHAELAGDCDCAVFVGGVYAGSVAGLKAFGRACRGRSDLRQAVLCVGASPYDEAELEQLSARVRRAGLAGAAVFYARGAWYEPNMTLRDRALCGLLRRATAKRTGEDCKPWMRALLDSTASALTGSTQDTYRHCLDSYAAERSPAHRRQALAMAGMRSRLGSAELHGGH